MCSSLTAENAEIRVIKGDIPASTASGSCLTPPLVWFIGVLMTLLLVTVGPLPILLGGGTISLGALCVPHAGPVLASGSPLSRRHQLCDDGRTRPKPQSGHKGSPHWSRLFIQRVINGCRWGCHKVQTHSSTRDQAGAPAHVTGSGPGKDEPAKTPGPRPTSKPPWASNYSMATLRKKQESDPDIGPVVKWKGSGKRPFGADVYNASSATRHYWNTWDQLEMRDGVLFWYFTRRDGTGKHLQYLVPRELQREIMHQMHNSMLSGHLGKRKTRARILQRFYWFGIHDDVNRWVHCCETCGVNKPPTKTPQAPLGDM